MKLFKNPVLSRLMLAFVSVLTLAQANAENRLYIDDFTINGPEPRTLAIMLENSDDAAGLQFNLVIPEGLQMVGQPRRNSDRFAPGQNMTYSPARSLFLVTSGNGNSFVGNSGALCWIDVQATPEALTEGKNLQIRLENIVFSTASGQQLPAEKTEETNVAVQDGKGVLSATPEFVINPSGMKRVDVALDNNFDVMGLQLQIRLPEGFVIMNNELHVTDRCSNGSSLSLIPREDGRTYGCVLVDYNGNAALPEGTGDIFWFDVIAPADFSAETAEIVFSNVEMSNIRNNTIYGDGCTVNVINGKKSHDAALARVAELQSQLDAALELIRTECPLVASQFTGTELQERINALRSDVDSAYEDYTLNTVYEQLMGIADGISSDINAYVESARKAQADEEKRLEYNKNSYEADLAKIGSLQAALDAAKAEIAEKYADFADAEAENAAQEAVNALKSAVEEAYAAVATEGYYNYELDTTAVEAQIAALVTDAKARFEADRQAKNKAAYEADLAKIAELQAALDAAKAEIAEKYADFADADAEAAAQAAVDALKTAVDNAYAAVAEEGVYDYNLDTTAVEAQIAALVTDAAARYEANRQAVNKAAYEADLATLTDLQAALDAAKAEIAEKYADYADAEAEAEAQAAIDNAKAAVEKEYSDVAEEGFYAYDLDAEAIEAMIATLVSDAKGRWAEANREAANKEAYEADLAKVADLQARLDAAKAEIAENYEGFGNETEIASIQNKIDTMKAAVENAYAAVAEEGVYTCELDVESVIVRIDALVPEAAEAYRVDFNVKAYNADLDAIAAVKAKYEEALEEIRTKYPDQINNPLVADVLNQITAAQAACMLEFENVRHEGFYESQVNVEALEQSIDDMLEKIKLAGVDGIEMDETLDGVEIYTLDGIRRSALVKGQVNVLRYKDGTVKKVQVK